MSTYRFILAWLAATLVGVALLATCPGPAGAAPVVKAPLMASPPSEPCDFEHRMDVAIVDGVWFECSCEALMVGTVCDWYEITSAAQGGDARKKARLAKRVKRIPHGLLYTPRVRPVIA